MCRRRDRSWALLPSSAHTRRDSPHRSSYPHPRCSRNVLPPPSIYAHPPPAGCRRSSSGRCSQCHAPASNSSARKSPPLSPWTSSPPLPHRENGHHVHASAATGRSSPVACSSSERKGFPQTMDRPGWRSHPPSEYESLRGRATSVCFHLIAPCCL